MQLAPVGRPRIELAQAARISVSQTLPQVPTKQHHLREHNMSLMTWVALRPITLSKLEFPASPFDAALIRESSNKRSLSDTPTISPHVRGQRSPLRGSPCDCKVTILEGQLSLELLIRLCCQGICLLPADPLCARGGGGCVTLCLLHRLLPHSLCLPRCLLWSLLKRHRRNRSVLNEVSENLQIKRGETSCHPNR